MEAIRSSETSVYPSSTQRHIPEDNILLYFKLFKALGINEGRFEAIFRSAGLLQFLPHPSENICNYCQDRI
jgi:hypothetical protein